MSSRAVEQPSEPANPPGLPVYRRRKFVITIAASLLLLVSIWVLAVYLISQERQRAFDAAAGQANAIATFFEGHVGGTFRYADDYIKTIRRIYLRDGSLDAVRRFMSDIPPDTTILSHITIMGADGVPRLISTGGAELKIRPGVNARDRDYFMIQRASGSDKAVVSVARKGRNTGLVTVRLVRRLAGPDGSFQGVIFAAVKATQLLAFFNATQMGANATATLVGLDRLIRLRSPAIAEGASRRIEKSDLWASLDQSPRGIYHQTSIVDGVPRFWTYRTVAGFPLVAVIGTAIPDLDAAFAQTARNGYGVAGLISAIVIVLVIFALRESATAQHLADSAARQKSGENALRASERRYRQLSELSPEGIIVHTDGRIVYVNPEAVSMLRADGPGHLLGMQSMDLIHPDDRAGVLARRAQVAAGGRTALEEARFMCFDGTVIDVERLGTAVDWEGNPSILLILRDVSDRNRAKARLRDTESLLRTLADSSPVLISYIGHDRRVRFCNTAFAARHGYDRDEIIGKHQEEFWGGEDHADVLELIDRTLAGQVTSSERQRRHADGSMHYHFTTRAPHFGPDGEVQGYLIVTQDITEQRQAENQLRRAQRMEAVGQLTGGIAHDFNNLLQIIGGYATILEQSLGAGSPHQASIGPIKRATARGAELTQRLLAYARRQQLSPVPTDINEMVAQVLRLAERTVGEQVTLTASPAADVWHAEVDPGQLENALINLILNARDAMGAGGTITIETANTSLRPGDEDMGSAEEPLSGDFVVIAVRDTGHGMPAEVLEKAFEPFFTTKDVGEGSGLGLSMVFGFTKQSGGQVRIESTPGVGTTVRLYLPRALESDIDPSVVEAAQTEVPRGDAETVILLVEDDPDVREYFAAALTGLGYQVIEAPDGPAALALIADDVPRIDLLLTDVILPGGMTGRDLAAEIVSRRPGIRTLFTSGYTADALEGALPDGRDVDLLAKPCSIEEIAWQVRKTLDAPAVQAF